MHLLKLIRQTAGRLIQRIQMMADSIRLDAHRRRQRPAMDALEAERIDRIRNPLKYLGKS
jgi:hypothetical protein